jgi:hypothetical protein
MQSSDLSTYLTVKKAGKAYFYTEVLAINYLHISIVTFFHRGVQGRGEIEVVYLPSQLERLHHNLARYGR